MMRLKEIQAAAAALDTQLTAGMPQADALRRMARLQPAYDEFWQAAADGAQAGRRLSTYLAGEWPLVFINAIVAGERSGTLPQACAKIKDAIILQRGLQKKMWGLAYPVGISLLALVVFIFYMVFVIPTLFQALEAKDQGLVFKVSQWMSTMWFENWATILISLGVSVFAAAAWLSVYENRERVEDWSLSIPVIGPALAFFYWAIWARYMALVDSTGAISRSDGLEMTSHMLPHSLRPGILLAASEVEVRGSAAATDPAKQVDGDPRKEWPFYISNAFILSDTSGVLDDQLMAASVALVEEGTVAFDLAIQAAIVFTFVVTSIFVALPIAAYFMQMGAALQAAMKG